MRKLLKPIVLLGIVAAGCVVIVSIASDWSKARPPAVWVAGAGTDASPTATPVEMEHRIQQFCGDCHPLPNPANFPASAWQHEVQQGYEFYARSGRQDLNPPPPEAVFRYFASRAPEMPDYPTPVEATAPLKTSFRVERRFAPPQVPLPEISTLHWLPLKRDGSRSLVASDMQYGQIVALNPHDASAAPQILAHLLHPAHVQPCSLSGDDSTELVVADLGAYIPSDHDRGRVVLLKRERGDETFKEITLASGFGRIADVRTADFDSDGRQDLVVAEFGWQETGGIWLLHNASTEADPLQFAQRRIDMRPGTIHVPVHDFNDDGLPDFAALISQEFETVDIFLNATDRQDSVGFDAQPAFDRYTVWSAPDLTFGSSGLQLSDMNGDGRMDVLITSGDAFDNNYITPQHGVHWLENVGELQFRYHRLANLPGAYAAKPCDVDNDGDTDVIAVSFLPHEIRPNIVKTARPLASIVCLEQTQPGQFVRHTLEHGRPFYSSVAVGDFDEDGDCDFAVGSGPMVADNRSDRCYLEIWWNKANNPPL